MRADQVPDPDSQLAQHAGVAPVGVHAAVILAGGRGSRLGGTDKPDLVLGGSRLLDIAIAAVAGAQIVVVGQPREVPEGVLITREEPIGSGPAAAIAAGVTAVAQMRRAQMRPAQLRPAQPHHRQLVAVLAADLPGLTSAVIHRLCQWVDDRCTAGAVIVDEDGNDQWLLGVWDLAQLTAVVSSRPSWAGTSARELLSQLNPDRLKSQGVEHHDLDTPQDQRDWERRLGLASD